MPELRTLTVRELIEHLERHPDDLPVCIAVPARDYWGNVLAEPVKEMETRTVEYSDYHRQFALPRHPDREDDDEMREHEPVRVLLLGDPG